MGSSLVVIAGPTVPPGVETFGPGLSGGPGFFLMGPIVSSVPSTYFVISCNLPIPSADDDATKTGRFPLPEELNDPRRDK